MSKLLHLEPFAELSVYFWWHFLLSSKELLTPDGQWVSWQWSEFCGGGVEQHSVGMLIPGMLWTGRHCEVARTTEQRLILNWLVPTAAVIFNSSQDSSSGDVNHCRACLPIVSLLYWITSQIHLCSTAQGPSTLKIKTATVCCGTAMSICVHHLYLRHYCMIWSTDTLIF